MLALVQRVREARVEVDGRVTGAIAQGLLALVCAERGDTEAQADRLVDKLLKLPRETRAYVPKLLAMSRLVADPQALGLEFSPIANEPYFAQIDTGGQIDLKMAAELAGIHRSTLYEKLTRYGLVEKDEKA